MARAATAAMRETSVVLKANARQRIKDAGFGTRWQNAFRVKVYPEKGISMHAAIFAYHKIPYANIFETGGVIAGSPLLWLPFKNIPQKIGGKRITPALFVQSIGPLRSFNRPGKAPMLAAYVPAGASGANFTLSQLRAGAKRSSKRGGGGALKLVPMFYGINSVQIKARFRLADVFSAARRMVAEVYHKYRAADRSY